MQSRSASLPATAKTIPLPKYSLHLEAISELPKWRPCRGARGGYLHQSGDEFLIKYLQLQRYPFNFCDYYSFSSFLSLFT